MGKIIILLLVAYILVNGWILWWFWKALSTSGTARWVICPALAALMLFFPIFYPHNNSSGTFAECAALTLGCLWIGSFVYVFMMTLAAEAVKFFAARYREAGGFSEAKVAFIYSCRPEIVIFLLPIVVLDKAGFRRQCRGIVKKDQRRPARRGAVEKSQFQGGTSIIIGVAVCLAVGGWINAAFPVLKETRLRIKTMRNDSGELPRPLTIAVMADVHLGRVNGVKQLSRAVDHMPRSIPMLFCFLAT